MKLRFLFSALAAMRWEWIDLYANCPHVKKWSRRMLRLCLAVDDVKLCGIKYCGKYCQVMWD
jgi:hypothetical protein